MNSTAIKTISINENVQAARSFPAPTLPEEPPDKRPWRAKDGNLTLDWDGGDLSAVVNGREVSHIFRRISNARTARIRRDSGYNDCEVSHSFRLASVVGYLVSFEQSEVMFCGTTSIDWRYTSIDLQKLSKLDLPSFSELENDDPLNRPGTPLISLADWFTEDDIFQALLANKEIAAGLARAVNLGTLKQPPSNLFEFRKLFTSIDYDTFGNLFFEEDFLTRFAFHHMDGEKVYIWISLTPTSHAAQAGQHHLEIALPIPEKLRSDLLQSKSQMMGFLMTDAHLKVGTKLARFNYEQQ
jgi:hypothetical protein